MTEGQMELVEMNPFHLCIHTHHRFRHLNQHDGNHALKVLKMTEHLLMQVNDSFLHV